MFQFILINVFQQYTSQLKIQPQKWAQGRKRSRMLDYAQFRELALDFQSCQKLTIPYRPFVMSKLFGSAELFRTVCAEYPHIRKESRRYVHPRNRRCMYCDPAAWTRWPLTHVPSGQRPWPLPHSPTARGEAFLRCHGFLF